MDDERYEEFVADLKEKAPDAEILTLGETVGDPEIPLDEMRWVVVPTREEDHNWCAWLIVGHANPKMIDRPAGYAPVATSVEQPDGTMLTFTGSTFVDAFSKAWRRGYEDKLLADDPSLTLDDVYYSIDDDETTASTSLAKFLRDLGYIVMEPASLEWAQGLISAAKR